MNLFNELKEEEKDEFKEMMLRRKTMNASKTQCVEYLQRQINEKLGIEKADITVEYAEYLGHESLIYVFFWGEFHYNAKINGKLFDGLVLDTILDKLMHDMQASNKRKVRKENAEDRIVLKPIADFFMKKYWIGDYILPDKLSEEDIKTWLITEIIDLLIDKIPSRITRDAKKQKKTSCGS